jgi:hypothetical protein
LLHSHAPYTEIGVPAPYTATPASIKKQPRIESILHLFHPQSTPNFAKKTAPAIMVKRTMPEPTIDVTHIAAAVVYMASLPLDANVPFMTVMATGMPYIGRG